MKNFFIFLAASFLIISCRNSEQANQNTTPKLSETDSLIKKFAPIINGEWVRADYVEDLKRTLSPLASYNNIGEDECDISIDSRKTSIDSAIVYISHGGAGSVTDVTFFKKGKMPNSIILESSAPYTPCASLGFEITASDTILILSYSDTNNKTSMERRYIHARDELTGNDSIPTQTFSGLAYFRNKLLVSGKYQYVDSIGKNATAVFNDFGKVTGFKNYKNYYVEGVFGQGPPDTDLITFNFGRNPTKDYLFKINKDTLSLFDFKYNDQYSVIKGSPHIAYKLIRQK